MYKLAVLDLDGKQSCVTRKSDGASIPFNTENIIKVNIIRPNIATVNPVLNLDAIG